MTWIVWLLLAQTAPTKDTFQSSMAKQRAAAATQREATRKQAEMAARWTAFSPPLVASTDCDPIPDPWASVLLGYTAQTQHIDVKLLRGVVLQESGFRPCAVSKKGAMGLMQLMPDTVELFNVDDAFDPKQNMEAGAKYLKQLLEKYKGNIPLALAAYNAGPTTVDAAGGIPNIPETKDYVDSIMKTVK